MSTRVARTRSVYRESGYNYVAENDSSSSGSSFDSNDYDDDDDGLGRSDDVESTDIEDYTEEEPSSTLEDDTTFKLLPQQLPVQRRLNFDFCAQEELDFLSTADNDVVPEPPRKKVKKTHLPPLIIDLQ